MLLGAPNKWGQCKFLLAWIKKEDSKHGKTLFRVAEILQKNLYDKTYIITNQEKEIVYSCPCVIVGHFFLGQHEIE